MIHSDGPPETTLVLKRFFRAPVARVYAAWSDPALLARWMGPDTDGTCSVEAFDFVPGGRYALALRSGAGQHFRTTGEFREIVPEARLSFTWVWDHHPEQVTLVTVTFAARDGGTALTLEQTGFNNRDVRDNHASGWGGSFDKLDRMLEATTT